MINPPDKSESQNQANENPVNSKFTRDDLVYLEPSKVKNSKGYFALARVRKIVSDPENQNMFFALIEKGSYLDFGDPVQFRNQDEIVEQGLLNEDGRISGRAQAAVRPISPIDFARIIELGLSQPDKILPRVDQISHNTGFEDTQATYSTHHEIESRN